MSEFKRRRGESASEWCARLGGIDSSSFTERQLEELTLRRVLAVRALRREARNRLRAAPTDEEESDDLRRCKDLARSLSDEDRRLLLRWLTASLRD